MKNKEPSDNERKMVNFINDLSVYNDMRLEQAFINFYSIVKDMIIETVQQEMLNTQFNVNLHLE